MAYNKVLKLLEEATNKELISLRYSFNEEYCALGLVCPSTRAHREDGFDDISIGTIALKDKDVYYEIKELGMTIKEAQTLQDVNDFNPYEGKSHRYRRVCAWLKMKCNHPEEVARVL